MILPVVAYGDPVLKKEAEDFDLKKKEELNSFIFDLFETMENAAGVGLAAPQVGESVRVFVVDTSPFAEDDELPEDEREELKKLRKAFINPIIVEEHGEEWAFTEGCLSIPGIREDVYRQSEIVIEYYNENLKLVEETYSGLAARVIQHEYDHIEGVLFTDKLKPLKRRLLQKKLTNISKGKVNVDYRMRFPTKKR